LFRKLALLGTSAALLAGSFAFGGVAHAGGTLNANDYTVNCDTLLKGSVGFAPPLSLTGTATSDQIKIKGTVTGCVATPSSGNPAVTVLSGSVSGLITGSSNNCTSLLGPSTATGTITIKWKTVPALITASTVITVGSGSISGGLSAPFADSAQYGAFNITGTTQTGAFSGTDGGASSFTHSLTVQGFNYLGAACQAPAGMKAINLGSTETSLG
jgi:hypothetical protein